ncbi:MAG: radical SAM protein [Candidatus Omnitrophica bacterium]|nr:radical SAM protein [Candidatus Omnitrophota bacterium]
MTLVKKSGRYKYIYGPVSSWRLGSSLGVDPLSAVKKICSFDCLYCQLGGVAASAPHRRVYVPTEDIIEEIKKIPKDLSIDYFTFSGRGEPTLALNLGEIIEGIRAIRQEKIAVITNASLMGSKTLRGELALADFVIAKIDAYDEKSFKIINRPAKGIKFRDVYNGIKAFRKMYKTRLAVQTMLFEENKSEYQKLAEIIFRIDPDEIELNTPLRKCAVGALSPSEISKIARYFRDYGASRLSGAEVISVYEAQRKKVKAISDNDTSLRRGKDNR